MALKFTEGKAATVQTAAEKYVQMEIQKISSAISGLWNSPERKQLSPAQQSKLKTAVDALSDLYFRELKG